jgi:purine-binding chemotaxis protein CheW
MEVITVPAKNIKPPLETTDGIGMEHLLGVCLSDNRVFMLLDIDSLLGPSEFRDVTVVKLQ